MSSSIRSLFAAVVLAAAALVALAASHSASGQRLTGPVPFNCDPLLRPCLRVANRYVRADVSPLGSWTMGTTEGDPSTALDDDKMLLYGYVAGGGSDVGSSFVTIRTIGPGGTVDFVPREVEQVALQEQRADDEVVTVWEPEGAHAVRITETLRLVQSPYSGRPDLVEASYEAQNVDDQPFELGMRLLLDVKIGNNDGAPYFVPGVGSLTREARFTGDRVPAYWLAFEDPAYDPSRLRGLGVLEGDAITKPDELWVAYWPRIQRSAWDYNLDVTRAVTSDSAVALLWAPEDLAPGEHRTISTRYGIAGNRGGRAFLAAPVEARCEGEMLVSLFVSNFDVTPLTGGSATLTLPAGLSFVGGGDATLALPPIAPGDTGSAAWKVVIGAGVSGNFQLRAVATFAGGVRHETSEAVDVGCAPATPPATPTPSATPTAPATPTAKPVKAGACPVLEGRVPPAAIAAALANPEEVFGWGMLSNPNLPPSPFNPPRRWLSVQTVNRPYSATSNPLIYKAGCP